MIPKCANQKQTGKPCAGTKLSREIDCEFSETRCLRNCTSSCPHITDTATSRSTVQSVPTNNVTKTVSNPRPSGTVSSSSGGCGCGGNKVAGNYNAYTSVSTGAKY